MFLYYLINIRKTKQNWLKKTLSHLAGLAHLLVFWISLYVGLTYFNTSSKMNLSANPQGRLSKEVTKKGTIETLVLNVTRSSLSFFKVSSKKRSFTGTNESLIVEINVSQLLFSPCFLRPGCFWKYLPEIKSF